VRLLFGSEEEVSMDVERARAIIPAWAQSVALLALVVSSVLATEAQAITQSACQMSDDMAITPDFLTRLDMPMELRLCRLGLLLAFREGLLLQRADFVAPDRFEVRLLHVAAAVAEQQRSKRECEICCEAGKLLEEMVLMAPW
jgi:hypothetical protein